MASIVSLHTYISDVTHLCPGKYMFSRWVNCVAFPLFTNKTRQLWERCEVTITVQNNRDTVCSIPSPPLLTCLKYGFPNSADSAFLQLSPNPGGVWTEDSLSSAAFLLRAIFSSCSGDRGAGRGLLCSVSTPQPFCFFWIILMYWETHRTGEKRTAGGLNGFRKCRQSGGIIVALRVSRWTPTTQRWLWTQLGVRERVAGNYKSPSVWNAHDSTVSFFKYMPTS